MAACADTNFLFDDCEKLSTNEENERKREAINTHKFDPQADI